MQEASGDHKSDWKPIASSVRGTDFTVNEISPRKDYNFRIRAEMENGDISEPTPPIQYYRSKGKLDEVADKGEKEEMASKEVALDNGEQELAVDKVEKGDSKEVFPDETEVPMNRESFQLAEYKPIDIDSTAANRTYYEHLTKFVPPRLPIDKPDMVVINDETVELSWREARVPDSVRHTSNLRYTLEVRTPPSFEWSELASGLKALHYTVDDLHPKVDYIFRVRAWNDYGCSEPSLPVSLYRPCDYVDEYYVDDDDWEREWEEQYGCQEPEPEPEIDIEKVPPKLPMDTPRIVTQTSESLWFSWLPARIPAYAKQTPISYVIEIKEPPSTQWRRDVTGLVDCQYVREGLDSKREYHIQIRAETEFGTSDPTLPLIIRPKEATSGMKKSSSAELKDDDLSIPLETSRLDSITAGVPPRMPSTRPLCTNAYGDRLTLSWSACRVPSYVKSSSVSYTIEKREPPGHVWTVLARDVTGTRYDVSGLSPDQDYMFRVRAKNDFGVSEPTLPLSLFREKDDYVPPKARSRSGSRDNGPALSWKRRSSSIDYTNVKVAEEDVLEDVSLEYKIPSQPEYYASSLETQYAVVGMKGWINLKVRGYPLPTVHWYHGEEKLEYGDQFNTFVTPQGGITLEIKTVRSDSVGQYKCYAENESGAAVKVVTLELADAPTVIEPLRDIQQVSNKPCTLTCRVDGMPEPSVKWLKDWRPLGDSSRIRMTHTASDTFSLEIDSALVTDSGVYSCTVENLAGKVTLTGRLDIDDPTALEIPLRQAPIEDFYAVLEEIGRGKNGVVHRVIESTTGRQYAANFMFLRNKAQKHFFLSEFESLRAVHQMDGVLKLHDAFETDRGLIFVTEILTGPELLERMIAQGDWTESRVAGVVKQLLNTLREFENLGLLHLDIKPSNIRMSAPDSDDVKLINFGLARFLLPDEDILQNYGSVGYASPEQIINDVMTTRTDLWHIGVLTYVLLSGVAPFTGNSESDVLKNTLEGKWSFDEKDFASISQEAQDFISQLLKKEPIERPSIEAALAHPWLATTSDSKINLEKLKRFHNTEKLQREATSVSTTPQLKNLTKILKCEVPHFTPAVDMDSGEIIFPDSDEYGDFLDEDSWYEWQLQFQDDPDSQELPVPSKDFHVHQARRTREEKTLKKDREDKLEPDVGTSVMFRNKIQPVTFKVGEDVEFSCNVVSLGDVPVVTWYRDETLLSDAYRTEAYYSQETGVARLKILNTKDYDAAVYKCVARNKDGRVSCQAPLLLGDKPSQPRRPVVTQTSGTEAFITWSGPVSDGNSYIMGYRVDYRRSEKGAEWTLGPYVNEEYCLISGLCPNTKYIFRVSCHNKYGTSPYSWASVEASTMDANAPAVVIESTLQPLLQFSTFTKQQLILPAESPRPSLTASPEAQLHEADPAETYNLGETISKGAYGEYKNCTNKESNTQCVMKIVPYSKEKESEVTKEFQILRNLRQFNVITVLESFISGENFYMVTEHLSGINVVQYLCLSKTYKEELVAHLVRQILDALQYLQNFGIAHLNLQPSSVVMATRRRPHIKLRDFTHAHIFDSQKVETVPLAGYPDFIAPEVIMNDQVSVNADVWSVAVLAFTMLSGGSPFAGQNLSETITNILFDRYCISDVYDTASKESVKFISKLFKRLPKNRPSVNDCLGMRWLQQSESMIKLRSGRLFHSDKLREFSRQYVQRRANSDYMNIAGVSLDDIPKPAVGPVVMPIFSDKLIHRHVENLDEDSAEMNSEEPIKAIRVTAIEKQEKEAPQEITPTKSDKDDTKDPYVKLETDSIREEKENQVPDKEKVEVQDKTLEMSTVKEEVEAQKADQIEKLNNKKSVDESKESTDIVENQTKDSSTVLESEAAIVERTIEKTEETMTQNKQEQDKEPAPVVIDDTVNEKKTEASNVAQSKDIEEPECQETTVEEYIQTTDKSKPESKQLDEMQAEEKIPCQSSIETVKEEKMDINTNTEKADKTEMPVAKKTKVEKDDEKKEEDTTQIEAVEKPAYDKTVKPEKKNVDNVEKETIKDVLPKSEKPFVEQNLEKTEKIPEVIENGKVEQAKEQVPNKNNKTVKEEKKYVGAEKEKLKKADEPASKKTEVKSDNENKEKYTVQIEENQESASNEETVTIEKKKVETIEGEPTCEDTSRPEGTKVEQNIEKTEEQDTQTKDSVSSVNEEQITTAGKDVQEEEQNKENVEMIPEKQKEVKDNNDIPALIANVSKEALIKDPVVNEGSAPIVEEILTAVTNLAEESSPTDDAKDQPVIEEECITPSSKVSVEANKPSEIADKSPEKKEKDLSELKQSLEDLPEKEHTPSLEPVVEESVCKSSANKQEIPVSEVIEKLEDNNEPNKVDEQNKQDSQDIESVDEPDVSITESAAEEKHKEVDDSSIHKDSKESINAQNEDTIQKYSENEAAKITETALKQVSETLKGHFNQTDGAAIKSLCDLPGTGSGEVSEIKDNKVEEVECQSKPDTSEHETSTNKENTCSDSTEKAQDICEDINVSDKTTIDQPSASENDSGQDENVTQIVDEQIVVGAENETVDKANISEEKSEDNLDSNVARTDDNKTVSIDQEMVQKNKVSESELVSVSSDISTTDKPVNEESAVQDTSNECSLLETSENQNLSQPEKNETNSTVSNENSVQENNNNEESEEPEDEVDRAMDDALLFC